MKNRLASTVLVGTAAILLLFVGRVVRAQPTPDTISCAFVNCSVPPCNMCPPDPMDSSDQCNATPMVVYPILGSTDPSGAVPVPWWNNLFGHAGLVAGLVRAIDGTAIATDASVLWEATNTFRTTGLGEENNNFTGPNRILMTGYLDQNTFTPSPTFVQIVDLPPDMADLYDVYIYTLGGVPNRGGAYAVNGGDPKFVVASATIHGDTVFNGPDFVQAIGDDPFFGTDDWGNYVVFEGLSGTSVTITAVNLFGSVPRAPINGFQIVHRQP